MTRAVLTYYPDLSDHPGPITRAWLTLEIGQHKIESKRMGAARADEAYKAIKRAFGDAIEEGDHGYGAIM